MASAATSRSEELSRLLQELKEGVAGHGRLMRRAIDANDLTAALKHAAHCIGELRSGALTPKLYYDLYLDVFDALGPLETFFLHLSRGGTPMRDVYEAVQHAGSVLQRLYLLVLAGSVLVRSRQAPARDVLADLAEHVKGVQHPQRGLFLRYFLLQKMKDKLPDVGSSYETEGAAAADAKDCVDFLTANLVEMNRLWTRMQAPASVGGAAVRNRKRRERERQELRLLVGSNLTRLSQLGGLNLAQYRAAILPRVLAEIISCKDRIAQAYLAEGLLQVFPVDYHLRTLDELLCLLPQLVADHATIKSVALALLARIQEGAPISSGGDVGGLQHDQPQAPQCASVLGLPTPPVVIGALSRDIDVFGTILQYFSSLASDPQGPFRPVGGAAGTGEGGRRAGGDDDEDATPLPTNSSFVVAAKAGGGASSGTSPGAPRGSARGSSRLASIREASDAAAQAQPLASLLEVFLALQAFSLALYPGHRPYVDAVLGATANALRDVLGRAAPADPALVEQASLASAMGGASAALGAVAIESLRHLLAAGGDGTSATATAASPALLSALPPQPSHPSLVPMPPPQAPASHSPQGPGGASLCAGPGLDEACSRLTVQLLVSVQAALGLDVLQLQHYAALMQPLAFRYRRDVAAQLLATMLAAPARAARVRSVTVARQLLSALLPLIRDDGATPADALPEEEERQRFDSEQGGLASLARLLGDCDRDAAGVLEGGHAAPAPGTAAVADWFAQLVAARDFFSWGGARRVERTFPALLHEALVAAAHARRLAAASSSASTSNSSSSAEVPPAAVFRFVHELCSTLAVAEHGELAIRCFLEAAQASGDAQFAHEFLNQAFLLYEDVADSRRRAACLRAIVAALGATRGLRVADYEALAASAALAVSRLLRKPDQARLMLDVARLYWRDSNAGAGAGAGASVPLLADAADFRRANVVLTCLQRGLRAADASLPPPPAVFVDVLAAYVWALVAGVPTVSAASVSDMLALAAEHVALATRSATESALRPGALRPAAVSAETPAQAQAALERIVAGFAASSGVRVPSGLGLGVAATAVE